MKSKTIQDRLQRKEPFTYGSVVAKHLNIHDQKVYQIRSQDRRIATYDHLGRLIWLNNKAVPEDNQDKQRIRKTTRQIIHNAFPGPLTPKHGVFELHYNENGTTLINDLTNDRPPVHIQHLKEEPL